MSRKQINNYVKDNQLLRAIGYRIPNQGMSSIDSLEVVGFLPQSVGDTVVAYDDITSKTGSDFDIDKMYIMLPNHAKDKATGEQARCGCGCGGAERQPAGGGWSVLHEPIRSRRVRGTPRQGNEHRLTGEDTRQW